MGTFIRNLGPTLLLLARYISSIRLYVGSQSYFFGGRTLDNRRDFSFRKNMILSEHHDIDSDIANTFKYPKIKEKEFLDRFIKVVENNFWNKNFTRKMAAELMFVSERQLNRKIGCCLTINFNDYLKAYRLNEAKKRLRSGYQITTVALEVGFSSPSYFSTCFKAKFNCSPSDYVRVFESCNRLD